MDQISFLEEPTNWPAGFRYQPDLISPADEKRIIERVRTLPLTEFEFHGYVGKRRTVSYGWGYDFSTGNS